MFNNHNGSYAEGISSYSEAHQMSVGKPKGQQMMAKEKVGHGNRDSALMPSPTFTQITSFTAHPITMAFPSCPGNPTPNQL